MPSSPSSSSPSTIYQEPSYTCAYSDPPLVKYPYQVKDALDDLPGISYALELFLASKMHESEDYCDTSDPEKQRLYFATGYGLIQCVKGLMSYEDDDLLSAIQHTKHGNLIASKHRKATGFFPTRLAGYVVSALKSPGTSFVDSMTPVERHAELTYAESLFEKALLGIVYSGDWLSFIKEALNMRATITVYRNLAKYVASADAEHSEGYDPSIDVHFRSGVDLGNGMSNIILSLLPTKLLAIVELFGYKGDRRLGLDLLMRPGGWSKVSSEPAVAVKDEGVRRTICDMSLLIFHLVISSFTFEGVDIHMAQRILDWNLKRYPSGVFFLFGAGRLSLMRSRPQKAIEFYTRATEVQAQYRNLHHISFWEISIANIALWDIKESESHWRVLREEATWSKAIYTYCHAICLFHLGGKDAKSPSQPTTPFSGTPKVKTNSKSDPKSAASPTAAELMALVPTLRQRIAGKSIPLEKFVARKSRKFTDQGNTLALPTLEMAYLFLAIAHAPRSVIIEKMLPEVENTLRGLSFEQSNSLANGEKKEADKARKEIEKKQGYWDDVCLAKFLEGVCMRYIAYPDPDADLDAEEVVPIPRDESSKRSEEAFRAVFKHGPQIELDHYIVYHAHYELGRLLACMGNEEGAKEQLQLVLSDKPLEVNIANKKGKYSMQNALHIRAFAAMESLEKKERRL